MQTYGVSHIPEVRPPVDLIQACNGPAVLIVATDGIWDNWKLEDCIGELLKPEVSACVCGRGRGSRRTREDERDEMREASAPCIIHRGPTRLTSCPPSFLPSFLPFIFLSTQFQYLEAVASATTDIDAVAQSFMRTNLTRAHANFGSSCDNMALTLCYLSRSAGTAAASGGGGGAGP